MEIRNTHLYLLCAISLLQACAQKSNVLVDDASKPNVIYIMADDMGYGNLSCYVQQRFKTPRLDQMASEGMHFTQHYAGTSVCAPSRSCLESCSGHTVKTRTGLSSSKENKNKDHAQRV